MNNVISLDAYKTRKEIQESIVEFDYYLDSLSPDELESFVMGIQVGKSHNEEELSLEDFLNSLSPAGHIKFKVDINEEIPEN